MDENEIFQEKEPEVVQLGEKKPLDTAALVLAIVAAVAAAFIPLISYVCGIIGLVFAIKHRREKRTTAALVISIVALVGAVVSNVIAAQMVVEALGSLAN